MTAEMAPASAGNNRAPKVVEKAVIRFAGDSGDGMQLTGTQFTQATALLGNDLATFPDFPAEIRAPIGTTFGVSAFQINFGGVDITTSGDALDVLVTMNPAALITNLQDLERGGLIVADEGSFTDRNLKKAGYDSNPLTDGSLEGYRLLVIDISKMTMKAVAETGLSKKDGLRCKNFWTLGLMCWMYGRKRQPIIDELNAKFANRQEIADGNIAALNAGHQYGETAELSANFSTYSVPKAEAPQGLYRTVTGSDAMAYGLVLGAQLADLKITFSGYPITPASSLLHSLANMKEFGVVTYQAEDEIAAVCTAIGASYGGTLGVTSSSGPGIALKGEAIGLAIATELPLIIVNAQRAGPSTGMPTKTEQSDFYQAVFGRNADAPLPVLASASSADCFDTAVEAVRLATKYMTPVIVLSDGYLVNAAEPWLIPDINDYEPFPVKFAETQENFLPYARDPETLARQWAIPGTPGIEHRIGGIERDFTTGNISYDAENHQKMTTVRKDKIAGIANDIPEQGVDLGESSGDVAVVGWGSTFGPIHQAVSHLTNEGLAVSHIHVRHLFPLPSNLGDLLKSFKKVIVPEMNTGQFVTLLRSEYLIDAQSLSKVNGQPFKISEIEDAVRAELGAKP